MRYLSVDDLILMISDVMRYVLLMFAIVCCTSMCCVGYAIVSNVTVLTRAAHNPAPKVWYRVPEGYKHVKGRAWRTLVIFGGRNCEGEAEVSGKLGWTQWADRRGMGEGLLGALVAVRPEGDVVARHVASLRRLLPPASASLAAGGPNLPHRGCVDGHPHAHVDQPLPPLHRHAQLRLTAVAHVNYSINLSHTPL